MREYSVKRECLRVIWSAINSAKPGQKDITIFCRKEDAAIMVNCLNIPQVRNALEDKDLSFVVKATSEEQFDLREQANVAYYALLVASTLLSEKTDRTAKKWLTLLTTHALRSVQQNAGAVARTISQSIPVDILDKDELGEELAQKVNVHKIQYDLLKTIRGGKEHLTVEQLQVVYNKLLATDCEVNINCDLPSAALIICILETTLKKVDTTSDPWFKGIQQLCNEMKANITQLVPESMELFIDVETHK